MNYAHYISSLKSQNPEPKFTPVFPPINNEELLEATKKNYLEQNIAHQPEIYYIRINEDNPLKNVNTVTTQKFYPTTTKFKDYINKHYPK